MTEHTFLNAILFGKWQKESRVFSSTPECHGVVREWGTFGVTRDVETNHHDCSY